MSIEKIVHTMHNLAKALRCATVHLALNLRCVTIFSRQKTRLACNCNILYQILNLDLEAATAGEHHTAAARHH